MFNKPVAVLHREPFFDNARLILIFLVVLGHFCETSKSADFAPMLRFFIYLFHIPAFVYISGVFSQSNDIRKGFDRGIRFLFLFLLMKIVGWISGYFFLGTTSFSLLDISGMPWFFFAMAIWSMATPVLLKVLDRRAWLVLFLLLALIVGYDTGIGSYLVFSRIIVFWPFFLGGTLLNREKAAAFFRKIPVRILGIAILLIIFIIVFRSFDELKHLQYMLSGQNDYTVLAEDMKSGFLVRLAIYGVSALGVFAVMAITPGKKYFFTPWGGRTLSVYFYDDIIFFITVAFWQYLHLWQYVLLAIGITILFSQRLFYIPLEKILHPRLDRR